jgi:hypothetical protein
MKPKLLSLCVLIMILNFCEEDNLPAALNERNAGFNPRSIPFGVDLTWQVTSRGHDIMKGPGENYFSSSRSNYERDTDGSLTLRIVRDKTDPERWLCAELSTVRNVGYGKYILMIEDNDIWKLDRNAVFGFFTYDDDSWQNMAHTEIDIEFSKWGMHPAVKLLYAVHPVDTYRERAYSKFPSRKTTSSKSTHIINWMPGILTFESYNGFGPFTQAELIARWEFNEKIATSKDPNGRRATDEKNNKSDYIKVPVPTANTRLMMNLWLYDAEPDGEANNKPAGMKDVSLKIRSVEYIPAEQP